jgi:dTMP kinase
MAARFITFEGGEGSGKSTQVSLLAEAFVNSRLNVIKTREPGGSAGAEAIRALLVNGATDAWDPVAETLLFYAARMDHMTRLVKPAIAAGQHVLCDRFTDSTVVYQGIGKKLGEAYVQSLQRLVLGNFMPDLTLLLDIDPIEGLRRADARKGGENRFESLDVDFHHAVRAGFLNLALEEPQRFAVIDASLPVAEVHERIVAIVRERLELPLA